MELYPLKVFLTVATERSFSRAGEKLLRTQPAISLAVQRLENELGEKLLDRTGRELTLTDAGKIVIEYCRRFENLEEELTSSIAELRDLASGRLVIGANESTCLYLIHHIVNYRRLYPKVKVQVRRTLSSKLPAQIIDGDLELGVVSYDPDDDHLSTHVIYDDHLCFVVSPQHRFAGRERVGIQELGMETFIAHNVISPYREYVIKAFQKARVRLNMDVEMPTVETIRMMVQRNEGVAFLPKMCVESELSQGEMCEIRVEELQVERKIRLIYPSRRNLSHAAQAFLEVVDGANQERAG
jgi:DNA-binding transcriptional LysR family regulator